MARVVWYGAREFKRYEALMETKLTVLAAEMVADIKQSMREPKSGIDVPRTKSGRKASKMTVSFISRGKAVSFKASTRGWVTRRSAPGEPPAVQRARLIGSVTYDKPSRLRRRVGTNVKYGLYLEYGKEEFTGMHVLARPWLRPALERIRPRVAQLLSRVG